VFPIYKANHQITRFIIGSCRNLQQHRVIPKTLSLDKIDAMLGSIGFAFGGIKLK